MLTGCDRGFTKLTLIAMASTRGFSWAYWEFGAGFGVYDREAKAWVEPIRQALLP